VEVDACVAVESDMLGIEMSAHLFIGENFSFLGVCYYVGCVYEVVLHAGRGGMAFSRLECIWEYWIGLFVYRRQQMGLCAIAATVNDCGLMAWLQLTAG